MPPADSPRVGVGALAPSRHPAVAVAARLGIRSALAAVVGVSFALRFAASRGHATPRFFPDEYIYTALGRSLGHLHGLEIRGAPAHFPAVLEPLVAAPFWGLFPVDVAYTLIQAEHALLMSLAALPAYLIARELRLSARYALLCAAFAVAVPDLVFSAFLLAGSVAYPLVLGALYAGLVALGRPARRAEAGFIALSGLATAARVQYVVLFAAFAVAALVVHKRSVVRAYPLMSGGALLMVVGAFALGPSHVLGYYSIVLHLHVGWDAVHWALVDAFLLALASGAILVPGAAAGILRPLGAAERAFALLTGAFAAGVFAEAALYASNGSERFQERYLFTLLPLVPIAFGLHSRRPGRNRILDVAAGLALVVALAKLPLSAYAAGQGTTDSPFLAAFVQLATRIGLGTASLAVALAGSALVVTGALRSVQRRAVLTLAVAISLACAASVGATIFDVNTSRGVRIDYVAKDPSWVDAFHVGPVVAIQTPGSPPAQLLEQLFWNTSIQRELLLGDADPTDAFSAPRLRVDPDGTLRSGDGRVLREPLLLQRYGTSFTLAGVRTIGRAKSFTLVRPTRAPRLRLLETGRYSDGWLGWSGRITVWPGSTGSTRGTVRFTLSLPRGARPVVVRLGSRTFRLRPGDRVPVAVELKGAGPRSVRFETTGGTFGPAMRQVSARSTMPRFEPAGR
jgi:hypothetical protein